MVYASSIDHDCRRNHQPPTVLVTVSATPLYLRANNILVLYYGVRIVQYSVNRNHATHGHKLVDDRPERASRKSGPLRIVFLRNVLPHILAFKQ